MATDIVLDATAVGGSVNSQDLITNFVSGSDQLVLLDSAYAHNQGGTDGTVSLATGATLTAALAAVAGFTVATISTNVATHTFATFLAGSSTITQLETAVGTALGTASDTNFQTTDKIVVAIDDGTHTGIIRVDLQQTVMRLPPQNFPL